MTLPKDAPQHNVGAIYSSNGEKYMPVLDCSCGFSTGRCSDWEEAGASLDEHVMEVKLSAADDGGGIS